MARALKKPKAIKRKVFEKDPDEQFVVVCKPFRQGQAGRWEPVDTNTVAEWLRRALGSRTNCVRAIYTLGTVRDSDGKLYPCVLIIRGI